MKLKITIEYSSGESAVGTVLTPEWVKWEKMSGRKLPDITEDNGLGMSDITFLAYHAIKRETAPNPMKPYDAWLETIVDFDVERLNPKGSKSEVSEG